MSSVKPRFLRTWSSAVLMPYPFPFYLIFWKIASRQEMKSFGEMKSPCLTPLCIAKGCPSSSSWMVDVADS